MVYNSAVDISSVFEKCNKKLDIVETVYHLVIYMQSKKIDKMIVMSKFIQHLC